jgi:outer membrane protein with beta-barrel domain
VRSADHRTVRGSGESRVSRGFRSIGCGIAVAVTARRGSQHIAKEDFVSKWIVVPIAAFMIVGAGRAHAQETPGPGVVEVTIIPGGVGFVTSKNGEPSFGNYGFGFATTYNINRFIGVEGELAALISTNSNLQFGDLDSHTKAPNFLNYNVNAIVTAVRFGPSALYAAGGIGGLTMFERVGLGVGDDNTFFVGNVGGGIKWYAPNSRWGLRGDYRFLMTKSSDGAPAFFGQNTRYAHKLYGGVILNVR